ncbi:response regulator transcription factor [Alteribacter natronophilus]|uniref:response regulator transcription factor n=1 Tax=Alteribacter natronophilus TaxID=2583810 RepID=UPI00110DEF4C|nr:response regulator transcription factor [Alteribacter natronophilus]TMW73922.1 response regulator transcription factor [Alteribacter natronophilus]
MVKILIVEDEIQMQNLLSFCLKSMDAQITKADSGEQALSIIKNEPFDIILLDILMPGMSGFEVLEQLEKEGSPVPVVILSALGETEEVVRGLNAGAYDYVTKPFEPQELLARVQSVIRRTNQPKVSKKRKVNGGIVLDTEDMMVLYRERPVPLTKKEFHLFARLFLNPGRVYTREQLLYLEWDDLDERDYRNVDAHIKNVREKLKSAGVERKVIETVWGIGYRIPVEPEGQT